MILNMQGFRLTPRVMSNEQVERGTVGPFERPDDDVETARSWLETCKVLSMVYLV